MFEGNAAVSVIPFAIPKNPIETYRQKAHEAMDAFVDEMASLLCSDDTLGLEEISEVIQQKRFILLGGLLESFIEVRYDEVADQQQACCPQCGKVINAHKEKRERELETLQGAVCVERTCFYCRECKVGFSPLDVTLNLSRNKKQHDLQSRALDLVADVPFERASHHFENLTGIPFSDHSLHELFEQFTEDLPAEDVLPSREEVEEKIREAGVGSKWRPILVVASDGAMTPLRPKGGRNEERGPGEYKEAKGFRIYLAAQDRILHLASWHQVDGVEQIGEVLQEMARRIPQDRVRIALIGDGASWLWNLMTQAFPTGRQILDAYHCWERVHGVSRLQYEKNPERAQEWVLATMVRLYYGKVSDVIRGLHNMKPYNEQASEEIRKLIGYLRHHKKRIRYRSDRLGGYPVGSGGIESANKWICHIRLKRSGAWWLRDNANGMMRLRCAIFNHTFPKAFRNYVGRQKTKRFATNA